MCLGLQRCSYAGVIEREHNCCSFFILNSIFTELVVLKKVFPALNLNSGVNQSELFNDKSEARGGTVTRQMGRCWEGNSYKQMTAGVCVLVFVEVSMCTG